jgi:hypothetical protein
VSTILAAGIWLSGCSAGSPTPLPFGIRPVLGWQPGSCAGWPAETSGIRGGCYRLAGPRLGVTIPHAQQAIVATGPGGGVGVLIVIGSGQYSAFQHMIQPPPGALPPPPGRPDEYQAPHTLAIVQHGKVLAAFPALYGSGRPGTAVRLQIDGLTRARANDLVRRLGM